MAKECPVCGTEVEEDAGKCPECGEPLTEENEGSFPEEEINECPVCGVEVEEGAQECPACGEPLTEEKEKNRAIERLTDISGLGRSRAIKLYEEGFESPEAILDAGMKGLAGIEQIGVRTARKIIDEAEKLIGGETLETEEVEESKISEEVEEVEETEEVEDEDFEEPVEPEETQEPEEEIEEEEGVVESLTEDLKSIVEGGEELGKSPKRVILEVDIQEYRWDLLPVLGAILIPIFFLILVASEFVVALLGYTSFYPAQSLYYLTPLPFIAPSWLGSLVLSLVIISALFFTTWKGYKFGSFPRLRLDKNMVFYSLIFSIIISVSLAVHLYQSQLYSGITLTIILLILAFIMLVNHIQLLRKKSLSFPRVKEKKVCNECTLIMPLDLENCPRCSSETAVLEEAMKESEEVGEGVWYSTTSFLKEKVKRPSISKEKTISEPEGVPEPSEGVSEPEEVPEWEEPPEPEEVEEIPEEVPEWEEPPEPKEKRFGGIADSIRNGLSSTVSFFQNKLGREEKAETEETPIEEPLEEIEEEMPEEELEEEIEGEGICPTCGTVIPADSEECPECGEELEPSEEVPEEEELEIDTGSALEDLEKAIEEVEEETEEIVLVCPICDAELDEDVDECPECGTVFVEEETEEEGGLVEETLEEE